MKQGKPIILDRYKLTTLVYHVVMGVNVNLSDFDEILNPDLIVYLKVDQKIQMERLQKRGLSAGDRRMLNFQLDIRNEYEKRLRAEIVPVLEVDTSNLSIYEVMEEIVSKI